MLDGILVIDKPQDFTSFDVVAKVRKALHTKKVGHTGTLDPLATGVLVVCVGKATKLVEHLTSESKIYDVEMKFGIKTNTADITGEIIETKPFNITKSQIEDTIKLFLGKQKQIPPMYSAIKINGEKLYDLARKGIEVERKARDIEIYDITNVSFEEDTLKYTVSCSKGTYVRTLCEDIAEKLGTVATMTNLRRIKTGEFEIKDSIKIEDISEEKIISIEKLFDKKIDVTKHLKKLLDGHEIDMELEDGIYNLYADKYLGIGKIINNKLKREIIL